MQKAFTRRDLQNGDYTVLARGRWANADLFLFVKDGVTWVVKDFSPCAPLIRKTVGPLMVKREYRALSRLQGIDGIPAAPFVLDRYALCYRFIPGRTLRHAGPRIFAPDFFHAFEALIFRMHKRHIVHLDVRNRRNILVTDTGRPALIDFQSSLDLTHVPKGLHRLLMDIDISGVYKNWHTLRPDLLDADRRARLCAMNRKRSFWIFKGYPLGMKRGRRR